MRSIKEIKEITGTERKLTDVFGLSMEEFELLIAAITIDWRNATEPDMSEVQRAIAFLEEVLRIEDFTPEQLFRMVLFVRDITTIGKIKVFEGLRMLLE